jgi:hypothetical protein
LEIGERIRGGESYPSVTSSLVSDIGSGTNERKVVGGGVVEATLNLGDEEVEEVENGDRGARGGEEDFKPRPLLDRGKDLEISFWEETEEALPPVLVVEWVRGFESRFEAKELVLSFTKEACADDDDDDDEETDEEDEEEGKRGDPVSLPFPTPSPPKTIRCFQREREG